MITSGRIADLEYDLARPDAAGNGDTLLVLLHGRGSHKGDLQALGPLLPADWTLLTPQAPYPGGPWGYGGGWAWYRYVADDQVEPETLDGSLTALDGLLASVPDVVGFTPGRIVLGGFSQGGTTSVAYALTRPGTVAAALNFSGFLAAHVAVPEGADAAAGTPVFWGHGIRDANIPIGLAERGRARLAEAGVPLVVRDYAIGHWVEPDEVRDAVAMIEAG